MASAYTPGLQIRRRSLYRARRVLPIAGTVLVQAGQQVQARDVIARTELPGDVTPINIAHQLSLAPADVPDCMLKREGEPVQTGDILARTRGLFGLFRAEYASRVSGTIEAISHVTGQVIVRGPALPVEVRAFVSGTVEEVLPGEGAVIAAEVTFVQGIFGIGGEAYGPLRVVCSQPDEELSAERITPDLRGAILIGGARVTGEAIRRARDLGVSAIISGGLDDADLQEVLGYDLGVAITGSERIGITVVITEGFGAIAMAPETFAVLSARAGAEGSVNGATQIRAGVMRPEIVIPWGGPPQPAGVPLPTENAAHEPRAPSPDSPERAALVLAPGVRVRMIRDPWFGEIGTVAALPAEPQVLESGSRARVLEVDCGDGRRLTVPRANVEILGAG
jgi:hypothetical protein